MISIFIFTY